jgi:hypothetical protein
MICEGKQQQWLIKYFINGNDRLPTRPSFEAIRATFAANPGLIGPHPLQGLCCAAK